MKNFLLLKRGPMIGLLVALFFLWTVPGYAQYFGQNKVQYEKFDFRIMKTEHFDIYYYPEEEEGIRIAARMAERWYARLSQVLNFELSGRQPLIMYSSSPHFQQTNTISGTLGEGTGGVTEMYKRRIILPFGASLAETDHVIGHELVHAFQYNIASREKTGSDKTRSASLRLPLWLIEGLAEYLSIGTVDPHTAMWMREASRQKDFPTIKKMANANKYFPYRYGQSLWAYISGKWGDEVVGTLLKTAARSGNYEEAIETVLSIKPEELSKQWYEAVKAASTPLIEQTEDISKKARLLFKGSKQNPLNIAPSVSPDGNHVIFLSTKDLFSIDMFIADADTGKIQRNLLRTAANPHFESIQFIKSAGSWDRESKHFVFAGISKGNPILVITDVEKGKHVQEIDFPELDEILSPTWAPDGSAVVFSAMKGGLSDIYLYDLRKKLLSNLTNDPFGDLTPAWSPDGKVVAFVTERFSLNMSMLNVGHYDLAVYDLDSGQISKLPGFSGSKSINPQWSSDSRSLYFVSDQNGISNIYKMDVANGTKTQATNLFSGVTGITSLSPALSLAQDSKRLVFTVYDEGNYSIYTLEESQTRSVEVDDFAEIRPDVLPPREKSEGKVSVLLNNAFYGLPLNTNFTIEDYKPKLKLDSLSQPSIGFGLDRFGTYAGGGMSMFFSDMMGYHSLAGMISANSRLMDSSFLVAYQNTKSRMNWGALVQRIPYVYGGYNQYFDLMDGDPTFVQEELLLRQISYEMSGFVSYPFSKAKRFELGAGFRFLDYNNVSYREYFDAFDGISWGSEKVKLPSAPSNHFGFANAALVYDTSVYGLTAPIMGQSYRFEVSPYIGSFNFINVTADYRKYFLPVKPFTLALRFMHFGRYGSRTSDSRLYPTFLGNASLVRGYNYGSYSQDEVLANPGSLNQLFGSRIAVANLELRFPLFGLLGIGKGYYGILPVDFNAFFDAGLAWDADNPLGFGPGFRKPVTSAGLGLRLNLFGYMVVGANYVKPFSRDRRPYFQLTFMPGF
ncbi:peptidase S9 [Acidobacteriota bacterium]